MCRTPGNETHAKGLYEIAEGIDAAVEESASGDLTHDHVKAAMTCYRVNNDPLRSEGLVDALVQKYSSRGKLVWAIRAGGANDDDASAVASDSAGNVYVGYRLTGPVTIGTKILTGQDWNPRDKAKNHVPYLGSQTSNRITKLVVSKYTHGGKLKWASEVGACIKQRCSVDMITTDEVGFTYAIGSFHGTFTVGTMCESQMCQTRNFEPIGADSRNFLQSHRTCALENMVSYNVPDESCRNIPSAIMQPSNPCNEKDKLKCPKDVFVAKIDHNGTVFWVQNIIANLTYMRYTPMAYQQYQLTFNWAKSTLLAYRAIPEKLSVSKSPAETMRLLGDRLLNIFPLYISLQDAYHIEIQQNKSRLGIETIESCVHNVNNAFAAIREATYGTSLEFYDALMSRAAFISYLPAELHGTQGISNAVNLAVENCAAYRLAFLTVASNDYQYDSITRTKLTTKISNLNTQIAKIDPAILTNVASTVIAAFTQPGLYFAGIKTHLWNYYSERIMALRALTGETVFHGTMQAVFNCRGSLVDSFPIRPTNHDIQRGGRTLTIALVTDMFKPLTDERKAILVSNMVSRYLPATGFQAKIRPLFSTSVANTSIVLSPDKTAVTITLPPVGPTVYAITSVETIVVSIPKQLTERGTSYPFVAQFLIRPDPTGILWNTATIFGDRYSRPTEYDMKLASTDLTASMAIAGDSIKPLTPSIRAEIIAGMVPSGYDADYDGEYKWDKIAEQQLIDNEDQMWLDMSNTRLNIKITPDKGYEIMHAETITVTIPASVTTNGYEHSIGTFIIRPTLGGTLPLSMDALNTGSVSYTLELKIAGDSFKEKSQEMLDLFCDAIHSPNSPQIANGFMAKVVPLMRTNLEQSNWGSDLKSITIILPNSFVNGYNPQSGETVSFMIPPGMTEMGKAHYFQPGYIRAGSGASIPWTGHVGPDKVSFEQAYLPENQPLAPDWVTDTDSNSAGK